METPRKTCIRCKKDLPTPKIRKDDYCTAKCKSADRWEDIKMSQLSHRPCDPDHGWF